MDLSRLEFLRASGLAALSLPGLGASDEQKKMFVHLALFKFKEEIPQEQVAEYMKELAGLKERIPVLKEFLVGKNVSKAGKGYQYAQVSFFKEKTDLQAYDEHPAHREVVKKVGPALADIIVMDFDPL